VQGGKLFPWFFGAGGLKGMAFAISITFGNGPNHGMQNQSLDYDF